MKVFAGLMLKNKNPAVMKNNSIKISELKSLIGINNIMAEIEIKKLPPASPSNPSVIFTELIIPAVIKNVTGIEIIKMLKLSKIPGNNPKFPVK